MHSQPAIARDQILFFFARSQLNSTDFNIFILALSTHVSSNTWSKVFFWRGNGHWPLPKNYNNHVSFCLSSLSLLNLLETGIQYHSSAFFKNGEVRGGILPPNPRKKAGFEAEKSTKDSASQAKVVPRLKN